MVMAEIHSIPRYSKKENIVTNNTLLLFNRLYHFNTYGFSTLHRPAHSYPPWWDNLTC